jgi:hypothetical protein
MYLTLHLVRHDLLRLRQWIAVWVAGLIVPLAIGGYFVGHNPFTTAAGGQRQLVELLPVIYGAIGLLGYILTIQLIQEHPLIGTHQFWLTRPISRARLLRAKAIGAFLIVGLIPVVVSVPWWVWCGFGVPQIGSAALDVLIVQALVIVAGAFIAVLTDSFSRALLWSLLFLAVVLFTMFTIELTANRGDPGLMITHNVAAVGGSALLLAAVVVMQFLVRRRGWWLGAAGATLVIGLLAAQTIPWPWLPREPRELQAETAAAVTVRFSRALAQPAPQRTPGNRGKELFQYVDVFLKADGIPEGRAVAPIEIGQNWNWERSFVVHRWGAVGGGSDPFAALGLRAAAHYDVMARRWRSGPAPLPRDSSSGGTFRAVSSFSPSLVSRMRSEPPHYAARSWWMLARPEIALEVPLAPGPRRKGDGHSLRIADVMRDATGATAHLVETHPLLLRRVLNDLAGAPIWLSQFAPRWGERPLVTINRERAEYATWTDVNHRTTRTILINGVVITWRYISTVVCEGSPDAAADWINHASFGMLNYRDRVVFLRDLQVERFELEN